MSLRFWLDFRSWASSASETLTRAIKDLSHQGWRVWRPIGAMLFLAMIATTLATFIVRRDIHSGETQQFDAHADALRETLTDALRNYGQSLRAGAGLYYANGGLSRSKWRTFVSQLDLDRSLPGIQGLGFASMLTATEVSAHEAEQRRGERRNFRIRPAGQRDVYSSIDYLEPDSWRNQRAIGFDMYSEPVRRRAMERARDAAEPVLSGKVILVQETNEDVQAGTLYYLPLYKKGSVPTELAERRNSLSGFIYAVFRMDDMIAKVLQTNAPIAMKAVTIAIYDGASVRPETRLFTSAASTTSLQHSPRLSSRLPLQAGGAHWTLAVSSRPEFERMIDWSRMWTVLAGGTVISLLMTAISAGIVLGRERSAQAAAKLSREIAARKRAQEDALIANRELIHRVKNTLAIVNSISSQTARHTKTVEDFQRSFSERLAALGRVHDLLQPNPEGTADLGGLIDVVVRPYSNARPDAFIARGPTVVIPQTDAMLYSLLINELATNATKYGAWSTPGGRVELTWQVTSKTAGATGPGPSDPATYQDILSFRWKESGGPPVGPPSRVGFGSTVLRFTVERSLGGTLNMSYEPDGVDHAFEIRLSSPRKT